MIKYVQIVLYVYFGKINTRHKITYIIINNASYIKYNNDNYSTAYQTYLHRIKVHTYSSQVDIVDYNLMIFCLLMRANKFAKL